MAKSTTYFGAVGGIPPDVYARPPPTEAREPDLMLLRRREAQAAHRRRLLDFADKIKSDNGKLVVKIEAAPCPCRRNHSAISVNGWCGCPMVYWLNMCQLVRLRKGNAEMHAWAESHPLDNYLERIVPEEDATYRKEDDIESICSS